ncbi:hypothetical protein SLS60_009994 [Paraconiothyrium brasiliense]|uniref:SRR1-like domain-containing protein n=1 Tax=Paraconiothyrium brasiliense TaxID=300254 RepID=A0ABR3QTT7_9PLEO
MGPTINNLKATYEYLDEHGNPKGTLWNKDVIKDAAQLQQQVLMFNEKAAQMVHEVLKFNKKAIDQHGTKLNSNELQLQQQENTDLQSRMAELRASMGTFFPGNTYKVRTISGNSKTLEIPNYDDPTIITEGQDPTEIPHTKSRLDLCIHGIVEISNAFNADDKLDDNTIHAQLYSLKAVEISDHERNSRCTHERPPWKLWGCSWDTGTWHLDGEYWGYKFTNGLLHYVWKNIETLTEEEKQNKEDLGRLWKTLSDRLKSLIDKYQSALKHIDKVICFGLGSLHIGKARSFVQHKAAATVAEALTKLRRDNNISTTPVIILAQDPAYCSNCIKILKDDLKIIATAEYEDFFKVDRNTFVVSFAPAGPIFPIIADLTLNSAGPAAMLCDEIVIDYMRPHNEEGNWIDNEPTKNLVEGYQEKCHVEYFGDKEDYFPENSYKDFFEEFPERPTAKNIAERVGTSQEDLERWKKGYADDVKICFGDGYLYVRKNP